MIPDTWRTTPQVKFAPRPKSKWSHCGQPNPCSGYTNCACGAEVLAELEEESA